MNSKLLTISFCDKSFEVSLSEIIFTNSDGDSISSGLSGKELFYYLADNKIKIELDKIQQKSCTSASKNLAADIHELLRDSKVSDIAAIAFLRGPGSFTSCRISCATAFGLKAGCPNIILIPTLVDEAVHEMVPGSKILMQCNSLFWHLYHGSWRLVEQQELLKNPPQNAVCCHGISLPTAPWPDITEGLRRRAVRILSSPEQKDVDLEPFYGFEI